MAVRRMFSLHVVDTDVFTEMSTSAQALYFHLGMHGDDDGFVGNPKKIARSVGCNDDDMRLLIAKGFVIPFDSGIVVIRDWNVNNTLKNDRYHETVYAAEKAMLSKDSSGRYEVGKKLEPCWNDAGSNMEPEPNLTKHNQTKYILNKRNTNEAQQKFDMFWKVYPKKIGKQAARRAFEKVKDVPIETILNAVEQQKQLRQWQDNNGQFIPYPATWLNRGSWDDEIPGVTDKEETHNSEQKEKRYVQEIDEFGNTIMKVVNADE